MENALARKIHLRPTNIFPPTERSGVQVIFLNQIKADTKRKFFVPIQMEIVYIPLRMSMSILAFRNYN